MKKGCSKGQREWNRWEPVRPEMSTTSWWVGLSQRELGERAAARRVAMSSSREAQWVSGAKILQQRRSRWSNLPSDS